MQLHVLPSRTGGAAENMAIDFLLLQRYPEATVPRFRHYGWRANAFTFGYAQKIAFVREQLPAGERIDLCRRPTGGGVVDHRADWTYTLVIPRGHPLEELRATHSYRAVHEALAGALRAQRIPAVTQEALEDAEAPAEGVCFERVELFDVVNEGTGIKIAGAAQKRNKHGLLFQGSVSRNAIGSAALEWDQFEAQFVGQLAATLAVAAALTPWPDFHEEELSGLTEQYSSVEWNERR
jgi:lipoyl(octanoyl) transferase